MMRIRGIYMKHMFAEKKKNCKKLLSSITASLLTLTAFSGISAPEAAAAAASWKFDFGGNGTASGYTGVSASNGYNAGTGYGFSGSVSNVSAGGSGALSDAVSFTGGQFSVDLPAGLYQVTVTTGNVKRTSIMIEGMYQMINLTGNNAAETIQVPVTDGQLNISAVAGMNNSQYSISAVEINQLNTTGSMRPTIWLCGDSTVCNYYNTADTAQHGWGQFLKNYVNTNVFEIRNLASSGQFAKGFYQDGQFEPIKAYGKPGDYYVISIGINDLAYSNADEYKNVVTAMVTAAKQRGMNVLLVKQQGRHGDYNRNPVPPGRWFGGQLDEIGAEQNVQVIDLFTAWQNFGFSIGGYDAMTEYYAADDDLHQSAKGAQKNAELFQSLAKIGDTEMDTDAYYTFKNTNSGLVMDIADGTIDDGTNVQQWSANSQSNQVWQLTPFQNGTTYYYIRSASDPNYVLKAMSDGNGGNIQIVPYSGSDSMMLFQFTKIGDGSYYISTRASRDSRFVEIDSASTANGGNVQQWEMTYHKCQNWQAVKVDPSEVVIPDPPPVYRLGDLNGDDKVNAVDLSLLKRLLADDSDFSSSQKKAADVNGDTAVNAEDARLHRDFLLGEDVEFSEPIDPRYYAVDQTWDQGVIEDTHFGYSAPNGYVNLDNNDSSSITFTVHVKNDGNYMMYIRYSNGTTEDRPMKVVVNGNTDAYWMQSFPGSNDWDKWDEIGLVLPLAAGTNTIQLISTVANKGGPNLDCIRLQQTDEPYAEIYDPNAHQQQGDGNKPTLFILGDSTVQSYGASYAPQQGWGYYLGNYFTEQVTVVNRSMGGRSSKKAYDEGRWASIADNMKAGDYVMIQFAINDASGTSYPDRYAPTCGNVDNPSEGSYEWYMTKFITEAKAKGGTPILVTTVIGMKAFDSSRNRFVNSYTNYCDACKQLASKYSIPCIDLNSIMVNHYNSVGYDTAKSYHMMGAVQGSTDGTHFCEKGADIVAGLVANAVKSQNITGLSGYVK